MWYFVERGRAIRGHFKTLGKALEFRDHAIKLGHPADEIVVSDSSGKVY